MTASGQPSVASCRWFRPRLLQDAVGGLANASLLRRGFLQPDVVLRWNEVAGAHVAGLAWPQRIAFPPNRRDGGILYLATSSSGAMELQYLCPQIIERVNACFGYAAVANVRFQHVAMRSRAMPSPLFAVEHEQ